jgi:O-antigen/teichoic acid export membrane protein
MNDTSPRDQAALSQNAPLQRTSTDRDTDLPLSRVVILLAVASLAGAVVIALDTLRLGPPGAWLVILIPYVALFCSITAAVLVFPLMAVLPRLRQPGYLGAAIWGVASSSVAAAIISYRNYAGWYPVIGFGVAGLASGLVYAHLARKWSL